MFFWRIVLMVSFALIACTQSALAAIAPVGKLIPDTDGHSGKYVIGGNEIALSREDVRTYQKALRGDSAAQYEFAKALNPAPHSRDAMPRVAEEAFAWAMRSAAQGDAGGENYVGIAYKQGDGVGKDRKEAERWLTKAVEKGSAKAMCNLAILHIENGDAERAVKYARKSALSGYVEGQVQWGRMNLLGQGVPLDEKKAVGWFMKAAKQNDIRAMSLLATCYLNGNGTEKNITKAIELYEKIAERKDDALLSAIAKTALAGIYFEDETVHDDALAVKWAMEALRGGGIEALARSGQKPLVGSMQYIIGLSFCKGKGVAQNDEEAKRRLELAVAWGSLRAKTALAEIAEEQRVREARALAAAKAREEAERRRVEEEQRRLEEEMREERRQRRELARQAQEERAAEILANAKKKYYEEKAREKWIELHYPEAVDGYRQLRDRLDAERMRLYQQGIW